MVLLHVFFPSTERNSPQLVVDCYIAYQRDGICIKVTNCRYFYTTSLLAQQFNKNHLLMRYPMCRPVHVNSRICCRRRSIPRIPRSAEPFPKCQLPNHICGLEASHESNVSSNITDIMEAPWTVQLWYRDRE